MRINIKKWREGKKLSQAQLAAALNARKLVYGFDDVKPYTAEAIAIMEKKEDVRDTDTLIMLADIFGVTTDKLLERKEQTFEMPDVTDKYFAVQEFLDELTKFVDEKAFDITDKQNAESKMKLDMLLKRANRKAKIALLGASDAGKSTLLNAILGKKVLPANWTPVTSAPIILKHIKDRPEYATENVYVFKDFSDDKNGFWDPAGAIEEGTFEDLLLESGGYELISKYGEHGENDSENVGAILVYLDSPALYNCDLVDLPGLNPDGVIEKGEAANSADIFDSRDTMLSMRAIEHADAYIYMQAANSGFMTGEHLNMVQGLVKNLPAIEKKGKNEIAPLGNLFIVASHAGSVGDEEGIKVLFEKAAERIWSKVETHPIVVARSEKNATGYEYSAATIRSRMFTTEKISPELTKEFFNDFVYFVEQLPSVQLDAIKSELAAYACTEESAFSLRAEQYLNLLNEREAVARQFDELMQNEGEVLNGFREKAQKVRTKIKKMSDESSQKCRDIYAKTINSSHIVAVIEQKGLKKNKADLQELVSILNSKLENEISTVLMGLANELKEDLDDFLKGSTTIFSAKTVSVNDTLIEFNAAKAFAAGISGLASYGALAAWAASCGNLGGYVLVAKAVSLLASIGIHVGGTAAAISAVSALGGPVIFGIAIAAISALTVLLALGGTWKRVIGNKIVKQYEAQGALKTLIDACNKFWEDTAAAFEVGINKVEDEWRLQVRELETKLAQNDVSSLEAAYKLAAGTATFYSELEKKLAC